MGAIRNQQLRKLGQLAATQAAGPVGQRSGAAATEYQLQRVRLGVDLRRLHQIESVERKVEVKRELLPGYQDWVAGVLAADSGAPDDVLVHLMIWTLDTGAFDAALPLAGYVVRHHLSLPDRFKSSAPTFLLDTIADASLKRLGQEPDDADPDTVAMPAMLRTLDAYEELVCDADVFDQVRAKMAKARGLATARLADTIEPGADGPAGMQRALRERALASLRRAYELDGSSGVKTRITQLERAIRATPGETA